MWPIGQAAQRRGRAGAAQPEGPERFSAPGFVALEPVFSSQVQSGHFVLGINAVGLQVRRPNTGELVIDTLFAFDPDSTTLRLALPIGMLKPVEPFAMRLALQDDTLLLFAGTKTLQLRQGPPGTNAVDSIPVIYEGPGKDIAQLTIEPGDTVLTWGDSTQFDVEALDSGGARVPRFYVSWSASDTTAGRFDAFGKLRAPYTRGVIRLSALAINGVTAAAHVTFIPRPTLLLLAGTDSAPAPVGQAVPLVARVVAADGLGVLGLPVRFRAVTPGGAVRDTVVISDSLGRAATELVVGDTLGSYAYDVRVDTLPPVRRTLRALDRVIRDEVEAKRAARAPQGEATAPRSAAAEKSGPGPVALTLTLGAIMLAGIGVIIALRYLAGAP